MSKLKLTGIVVMLSIAAVLSGCSLNSEQTVVREGFANLFSEVDTSKMDITLDLAVVPPAGLDYGALDIEMVISGVTDNTDIKNPKLFLDIAASGAGNGVSEQSGKAEMILDGEVLYANVSEISDFDGLLPAESMTDFIGKWWRIPFPGGSIIGLTNASADDIAAQDDKLFEIMRNTDFLTELQYIGEESISGENSLHYSGVLNHEGVVDFISETSIEFNDYTPTESEIAELRESLDMVDLNVDVWIGQDDDILRKASGTMKLVSPEDGAEVNMDFVVTYSGFNEPVTIVVPVDAEEFDPLSLLMMGAGAGMEDFPESDFSDLEGFSEADFADLEAELSDLGLE